MSVSRGPEGFRHFSKSDLLRVTELATRKQWDAEQRLLRARRGVWKDVVVSIVLAFAAGVASCWWAFR